jgi:hypothetical protein
VIVRAKDGQLVCQIPADRGDAKPDEDDDDDRPRFRKQKRDPQGREAGSEEYARDASIYLPAGSGAFACTVIGAQTTDGAVGAVRPYKKA